MSSPHPEPSADAVRRTADRLIAARGIGLCRDGRWLLENVDLDVESGEIVTLVGPNGAGKTLLLRILLGLLRPDRGTVERKQRLRVGFMPQRFQVERILPLSVARLMTATSRHSRAQVADALEETGVSALIDAPVQALSGGELQRVLLARALLRAPELMVLDEPVQGVDFHGEAALYQLISDIRRRYGCGILLVSHDLHVVMASTDRVVCLNRHVCCTGTPRDVGRHPAYRELFGPRAQALAVYDHEHDHGHDVGGEVVPLAGESAEQPRTGTASGRER